MPWPTTTIPTANMDAGTDNAGTARADILLMAQNVNAMRAARRTLSILYPNGGNSPVTISSFTTAYLDSVAANLTLTTALDGIENAVTRTGPGFGVYDVRLINAGFHRISLIVVGGLVSAGSDTFTLELQCFRNAWANGGKDAFGYTIGKADEVSGWHSFSGLVFASAANESLRMQAVLGGSGTAPSVTLQLVQVEIERV